MSRIGKMPVSMPAGVKATIAAGVIRIEGPKGALEQKLPPRVEVDVAAGETGHELVVRRVSDDRISRSMHGLARSLVRNMVQGVTEGFTKTLEIVGVGYRAEQRGEYLIFSLGYSHRIHYEVPEQIEVEVHSPTRISVRGLDRQQVGAAAAKIRSFRPPEPYKGKGIRYLNEAVRRKEGKSGAR